MSGVAHTASLLLVGLALLGVFVGLGMLRRLGAPDGRVLAWPWARSGASPIRLSPEHALHVVELEGRRWLVGTGPAAAPSLLAELDAPVAPARAPAGEGA